MTQSFVNKPLAKLHRWQWGYTLLEVLVVIAILGAIVAIAIPNILGFVGEGESETAMAELHNIRVAVTAALHQSTDNPKRVVPWGSESVKVQITVGASDNLNDPSNYILRDTEWTYYISESGDVAQGERVS